MKQARYQRVLLKLSGEAFQGDQGFGISTSIVSRIAQQVKAVALSGVQVAIVVGGGNIWRGTQAVAQGVDRVTGDYAGMLATVINSLVLQDTLEKQGIVTRLQSAIDINKIAEPYIRRRAIRHLEKGRVVILAAGTGNPYMTTDTAAALRAIELGAEILLMAKNNVDGVYSADPRVDPQAKRYDRLSHDEALNQRLGVMDATALSLCLENHLPILVFDLMTPESIEEAVSGLSIGTLIS